MDLKIGQKVLFGRSHGEQTLGEIVKINQTRAKVRQLESRGTYKAHAVGTVWTVPFTLLSPVSQGAAPVSLHSPFVAPVAPKRPEPEILREIEGVYARLSPENLTCDGELRGDAVRRRAAALNKRLRELFAELGREVSEDEAYRAVGS
jgi:hypothetical protein